MRVHQGALVILDTSVLEREDAGLVSRGSTCRNTGLHCARKRARNRGFAALFFWWIAVPSTLVAAKKVVFRRNLIAFTVLPSSRIVFWRTEVGAAETIFLLAVVDVSFSSITGSPIKT